MRVRVKPEVCCGHSMCAMVCPEIFAVDGDTGHASVSSEDVPARFEEAVRMAKASCPEEAIDIDWL